MRVVLAVTGSAAAYRAIDAARELARWGHEVRLAATREALRLVGRELLHWAVDAEPLVELTGGIEHVKLARWANVVTVAPCTLETAVDVAEGHAGKPVAALVQEALGLGKPVLLAPAMHGGLYSRLGRVTASLREQGVAVLPPAVEGGRAKLPPPEVVAWATEAIAHAGAWSMAGERVLVTAGATLEWIDDARVITNPASGLMGVSLALEALARGAEVSLIAGKLSLPVDARIVEYLRRVTDYAEAATTEEMLVEVKRRVAGCSVALYAAAPADFKPTARVPGKISSRSGGLELKLEATPKIIDEAVDLAPEAYHVAFTVAPESASLVEWATSRLRAYPVDAVYANKPDAFSSREASGLLLTRRGLKLWTPRLPKRLIARTILDAASVRA